MSRIISKWWSKITLLSILIVPFLANASMTQDEVVDRCEREAKVMSIIQVFNQTGEPISEAYRVFPKSYWAVIEYAYTWTTYDNPDRQYEMVVMFYNDAFLACIEILEEDISDQ